MNLDILLTGVISIISAVIGGGISYLAQSAQKRRKNVREDFQAFGARSNRRSSENGNQSE